MNNDHAYQAARQTFDAYAHLDAPEVPTDPISRLQVLACRWQRRCFPLSGRIENMLGVAEEIGELVEAIMPLMAAAGRLSHAVLKSHQRIRNLGDEERFRAQAADAVADLMVFATQLCTTLRVDFGTLYQETLEVVLKRDWIDRPTTG